MAIFLQVLCARLGIASGRDLAQACRTEYSRPVAIVLWLLCEIAIIACDLAEVVGSAVALNLLFGLPLVIGVLITSLDVMLLLAAMHFGFRKIEAIVLTLVSTVAICFAVQVFLAKPEWASLAAGLVVPHIPNAEAFYIALGILGATVMPHNLYLHTALAAPAGDAPARHRAGGDPDRDLGRQEHGRPAGVLAGRALDAAAVRDLPAHALHLRRQAHGRVQELAVGEDRRLLRVLADRRPQHLPALPDDRRDVVRGRRRDRCSLHPLGALLLPRAVTCTERSW